MSLNFCAQVHKGSTTIINNYTMIRLIVKKLLTNSTKIAGLCVRVQVVRVCVVDIYMSTHRIFRVNQ